MRSLLITCLVGASLAVTGCASEQEQWCQHVEDAAPDLGKALDSGGAKKGLVEALPILRDLADDAPDDVRGEWRTLVDAVGDLDRALAAHDEKATRQAALKLASPDVQDAADTVEQEARDVCHTALF
jgi:predicted Zn-dependent protease